MPETTSAPSFFRQISAAGIKFTFLLIFLRLTKTSFSDNGFFKEIGIINLFTKNFVVGLAK